MTLVEYIIGGIFVVIVAILSLRRGNPDKGKDYEQRRDEMYEFYENRMDEFKATEMGEIEEAKEEVERNLEEGSEKEPEVIAEENLEEDSEEAPEGE